MMNKKLITIAILAGAAFASVAQAADGTINFTGSVIDTTCTISGGGATQTVALGTVSKASLDGGAGKAASPTRFSISLASCPAALTTASVKFDGTTNANNSSLLAITPSTGYATGVGVGIYEENNSTLIPIGTASAGKDLSGTNSATFNFIAKYVAATGTVTSGPANAVTEFTIAYN